jgi:type II secretory pathway pseudopilin PulG
MFRFVTTRHRQANGERGYFLIAAIFAVTLMIIALAASIPAIRGQIKRDRETELIHRGNQYVRAIQLFYRKFGRYPNSIDDLVDTNNIRFLRAKYTDPVTGKDEWRLIHYGEAQPKPLPPYISRPGGAGAGGGAVPAGGLSSGVSTAGTTNASDMSSRVSSSTTNSPGTGPIVGVASTSEQTSLKEVDGKTKYSDWEFVYDPSLDASRGGAGANNGQGQGLGNGNNGGRGNPGNFGNPNGGGNPNPTPRPPGGR